MKTTVMFLLAALALGACERRQPVASREAALEQWPEQWPEGVEDPEGGIGALPVQVVTPEFHVAAAQPADEDGDGFDLEVDVDDANPLVYPGAEEVPCNGVDEDGDTVDPCPPDVDGDGARAELDCDDLRPDIRPLLPEIRCNGVDENCDGFDDCDRDGDGFFDYDDLDPDDPAVNAEIDENPQFMDL